MLIMSGDLLDSRQENTPAKSDRQEKGHQRKGEINMAKDVHNVPTGAATPIIQPEDRVKRTP